MKSASHTGTVPGGILSFSGSQTCTLGTSAYKPLSLGLDHRFIFKTVPRTINQKKTLAGHWVHP